jgi:hypothetical protein
MSYKKDDRELDVFAKSSFAYLDKMAYSLTEAVGGLKEGVFGATHNLGMIQG